MRLWNTRTLFTITISIKDSLLRNPKSCFALSINI